MVYDGLFGMMFLLEGIVFAPMKPGSLFANTISLQAVQYRGMVLNIQVDGSGMQIASFSIDGQTLQEPFLQGNFSGTHSIAIRLVETAADYASQQGQFPIDIDKSLWGPYAVALGMAMLFLMVAM
jgi:hypothetical protein